MEICLLQGIDKQIETLLEIPSVFQKLPTIMPSFGVRGVWESSLVKAVHATVNKALIACERMHNEIHRERYPPRTTINIKTSAVFILRRSNEDTSYK